MIAGVALDYKSSVRLTPPDKPGGSEELFRPVREAFDVLGDSERRAVCDKIPRGMRGTCWGKATQCWQSTFTRRHCAQGRWMLCSTQHRNSWTLRRISNGGSSVSDYLGVCTADIRLDGAPTSSSIIPTSSSIVAGFRVTAGIGGDLRYKNHGSFKRGHGRLCRAHPPA